MSDDWDDNSNDNSQGPKALRDHLAKIEAELKAERERNAKLEADNRHSKLEKLLTSQGFNPKIAAVVPSTVEADKDRLTAWLDENAELFPKATGQAPPSTDTTIRQDVSTDEDGEPPVDRIGAAMAAGLPPERMRDLEAEITNAKTTEDLDRIMQANKQIRFR